MNGIRKQIVDHHRLLFYEHIHDGYDVFIHSEDDELIRPTNVLAFMHEMEKVRQLVGDEVSRNDGILLHPTHHTFSP